MTLPESVKPQNVPVPTGRRVQLAIKRWLPFAFFGLSCLACLLLWQSQQQAITLLGEVEVVEFSINSAENGIVSALVPGQAESELTFLNIDKDELVAVLDDRFLVERLRAVTSKLDVLSNSNMKEVELGTSQLRKTSALLAATMQLRQLDPSETERRQELSFEIEKIRADIGFDSKVDFMEESVDDPVEVQLAKQKIRSMRNELTAISISIARLDSRSPIEGRITKLHVSPGDAVVVGQQLLTLVPIQGRHAIAYTRENSNMEPFVGMPVTIRTRTIPVKEFETSIDSVGPAIESIPGRQRALAQLEEWGRPIRVKIPSSMKLAPGALIEVLIDPVATRSN